MRYIVIIEVQDAVGSVEHDTAVVAVKNCELTVVRIYLGILQYVAIEGKSKVDFFCASKLRSPKTARTKRYSPDDSLHLLERPRCVENDRQVNGDLNIAENPRVRL